MVNAQFPLGSINVNGCNIFRSDKTTTYILRKLKQKKQKKRRSATQKLISLVDDHAFHGGRKGGWETETDDNARMIIITHTHTYIYILEMGWLPLTLEICRVEHKSVW